LAGRTAILLASTLLIGLDDLWLPSTGKAGQTQAVQAGGRDPAAVTVTPKANAGRAQTEPDREPVATATPARAPAGGRRPKLTATPTRTAVASPPATATSTRTTLVPGPAPALTTATPAGTVRKPSGPLVIDGKSKLTIDSLKVTSSTGPCIVIRNSHDIAVSNSEIGKCKGNAIEVSASTGIRIVDNYIHPEAPVASCCDNGDGIFIHSTSGLHIQGNVIAYGETNIELQAVTDVSVTGNFLLNPLGPHPRGQHVQVWGRNGTRSRNIQIVDNYLLSSSGAGFAHPEAQLDAINIGHTDSVLVENNYISGGKSASGCGLIADDAANLVRFLNNVLVETGQCAIGIASGGGHLVHANRAYGHGVDQAGAGNTAVYVWNQYAGPCGPVQVSSNTAVLIRANGSMSSFWQGPGCASVTALNNVWDGQAKTALSPVDVKLPPPSSVPPRPYARKTESPYSR
jgi:hypothetical protein